jgi:hypothetical protein
VKKGEAPPCGGGTYIQMSSKISPLLVRKNSAMNIIFMAYSPFFHLGFSSVYRTLER